MKGEQNDSYFIACFRCSEVAYTSFLKFPDFVTLQSRVFSFLVLTRKITGNYQLMNNRFKDLASGVEPDPKILTKIL
jgi:hypothetical protein